MKKYLLGLFAVVFAVMAVAFVNPKRATKNFIFNGTAADLTDQTKVNDPAMWRDGSALCNNTDAKACAILTVDEAYYHETAVGSGVFILNTQAYAQANPGESQQVITSSLVSGGTTYYVTSVSSGTKRNKS